MTLRAGLLLTFLVIWTSCSDNSGVNSEELSSSAGSTAMVNPVLDESSIVCGVFFTVNEFTKWQNSYLVEAHNTIVYLQSAEDPNMVVVFEGNQTLEDAKTRVAHLMGEEFRKMSGTKGKPTATYYDVIYYKPAKASDIYFLALSFRIKDIGQLDLFGKSKFDQFKELGLRPIGLGSNPVKADDVYMLFTVEDIDLIRQKSNSAGKLRAFMAELNLPTDASMSYWAKP